MIGTLSVLLLPLLASGAAVQLDRRQFGGRPLPADKKAFKIEQVKPLTNIPGAKRFKYIYGPYKIKDVNNRNPKFGTAESMDTGGTSYENMAAEDFPSDVTVLRVQSELQTKEFKRAGTDSGLYNHHNLFAYLNRNWNPPNSSIGNSMYNCAVTEKRARLGPGDFVDVFAAGATESGDIQYKPDGLNTGYYIAKDRMMQIMIDVINYREYEQEVYTSTEIEYLDGKQPGWLNSIQQRVDPGICGGPNGAGIHPPKGVSRFSVQSEGVVVNEDGYLYNLKGHMHDGGVNINLTINDKEVCDSRATYGGEGYTTKGPDGKVWETLRASSECFVVVKVKKGDRVQMKANYDVELHPSRAQGGHGSMMGGMRRFVNPRAPMDGDAEQMALFIGYFAREVKAKSG